MINKSSIKKTETRLLQKIAKIIAVISTLVAIACVLYVALYVEKEDVVMKASFGASAFFFFMVGLVLKVISDTNIPDLKISDNND